MRKQLEKYQHKHAKTPSLVNNLTVLANKKYPPLESTLSPK